MEFQYRVVVQDGHHDHLEKIGVPAPCCGEMTRAISNDDVELVLHQHLGKPVIWMHLWHYESWDETSVKRSHYTACACPFCGQPFTFVCVARVKRVTRTEVYTREDRRTVNEDTPLPLEEENLRG